MSPFMSRLFAALPQVIRDPARRRAFWTLLVVASVLVTIGWLAYEIQPWRGPEQIARFFDRMGPLAAVAYSTLIALAVVVPPIPDSIPVAAAGAGFGAVEGAVYSIIGIAAGTSVAFCVARRFGRSLLERHAARGAVRRLDGYVARMGWIALFTGNLLGVNSGLVSYAAGLAGMRFAAFLSATVLGVLPQVVVIASAGEALREQWPLLLAGAGALLLLASVVRTAAERLKARRDWEGNGALSPVAPSRRRSCSRQPAQKDQCIEPRDAREDRANG